MASKATDKPLGGGLYLDRGGKSYVFRGKVGGRSARKVLRRPETDEIATTDNTSITDARRFILDMKADAANGGKRHFSHIEARRKPGDWTVARAWAD